MEQQYYESQEFKGIKLENEVIEECEFVECTFTDCTFENCRLLKCVFSSCQFYKCSVANLKCDYSQMKYSEFTSCTLTGIDWLPLLPNGRFAEPISKLQDCHLKYNTFTLMSLKRFDFAGNEILRSMFAECNLEESSFKGCRLGETEFFKCDVRKADFREALGYKIDIATNQLKGAKFSFPEVVSLLDALGIKID